MTTQDDLAPYVPQWLLDALQPGTWVRFRMGKRMNSPCEHCGFIANEDPEHLELLAGCSGQVFRLVPIITARCPKCRQARVTHGRYAIYSPHVCHGTSFASWVVHAAELTPVEPPDA